jgi:hypothetical protein
MSGDCAHCKGLDSSIGYCTCDEPTRTIDYDPCPPAPCKADCFMFDTCTQSKRCGNCRFFARYYPHDYGFCADEFDGDSAPKVNENHGRDCERFTYLYKEED